MECPDCNMLINLKNLNKMVQEQSDLVPVCLYRDVNMIWFHTERVKLIGCLRNQVYFRMIIGDIFSKFIS